MLEIIGRDFTHNPCVLQFQLCVTAKHLVPSSFIWFWVRWEKKKKIDTRSPLSFQNELVSSSQYYTASLRRTLESWRHTHWQLWLTLLGIVEKMTQVYLKGFMRKRLSVNQNLRAVELNTSREVCWRKHRRCSAFDWFVSNHIMWTAWFAILIK